LIVERVEEFNSNGQIHPFYINQKKSYSTYTYIYPINLSRKLSIAIKTTFTLLSVSKT